MRTPGDAAGQPWTTGATTSAACATPQWDLSEERRVQQGFDRNQLSKFTYRSCLEERRVSFPVLHVHTRLAGQQLGPYVSTRPVLVKL